MTKNNDLCYYVVYELCCSAHKIYDKNLKEFDTYKEAKAYFNKLVFEYEETHQKYSVHPYRIEKVVI